MSIVFAGAPIVNAVVAMYLNSARRRIGRGEMAVLRGDFDGRNRGMPGDFLQAAARSPSRSGRAVRCGGSQSASVAMTGDFPTREAMASHQLAQLRRLLATILPGNAFYRNKLAGIDTAIASLEDFSARFPFTTKQELAEDQRSQPPFGSNLTFPLTSYTRYHQTSGTTSAPCAGWTRRKIGIGWCRAGMKFTRRRAWAAETGFILLFPSGRSSGSGWPLTRRKRWAACASPAEG